jgi:hypothetical protein
MVKLFLFWEFGHFLVSGKICHERKFLFRSDQVADYIRDHSLPIIELCPIVDQRKEEFANTEPAFRN